MTFDAPNLDPTLSQEALNLIRNAVTRDRITDQSQQFWDQIVYDSHFRGIQNQGSVVSMDGRLRLLPYSLQGSDRWSDTDPAPPPEYSFNLFRRAVRMFTALFGVRAPNTRMVPINRRDPVHVRRASVANRMNHSLDAAVDMVELQSRLSFLLAKSGTVFGYTRWVSSKDYGSSRIPNMVSRPFELAPPSYLCPSCGATGFLSDLPSPDAPYCIECGSALFPEDFDEGLSADMDVPNPDGSYTETLNGSVLTTLHTLASVTIPPGYRRLQDCPWLALVEEVDIGKLSETYNIPAENIQPFTTLGVTDSTGPQARSAIGSYDGRRSSSFGSTKGTLGIYWIQSCKYAEISNQEVRAQFQADYPDGLKLSVIGAQPVRMENESLTEVWSACLPEEYDNLTAPPYLADSIPISQIYNDMVEIAVEAAERSIPINIFDPDILQDEDLRNHGRRHAGFVPSKTRGRDLSHAVQSFKPAEFHPETVRLSEELYAKHDEIQGLLPIIWGSVAGAETAYETSSAKNQALAMLAIPWVQMRKFHERIRRQALLQTAKYSDGRIHLPVSDYPAPSNVVEIASIQELEEILQGGWMPESDEQMPVSAGQVKQELMHLLTNSTPETQQALELLHPVNLPTIYAHLGLPGMRSPMMEAVDAANQLLESLLQAAPIQTPEGELLPSEQLDAYLYEPSLITTVFKPWLISEQGRQERMINEAGWANVRAFAMEAERILQEREMQQMQAEQEQPPMEEGSTPPEGDRSADSEPALM